ncbi:MAG TPA: M48 family metallopeptidase [Symbiobacteriaceae bacterium]|jgi:STE24 endopeptidase|nr:M48 family metallopeptidase [Symbiobacteriaceae bacterium]
MDAIMPPERMETAKRYHVIRYRLLLISLAVTAAYLLVLVAGGATWLYARLPQAPSYVGLLYLGLTLVGLPVDYYGYRQATRFGLSVQGPGAWLMDQAKSFLLGLVLNGGLGLLVLWAWAYAPGAWYIWAAAVAVAGDLLLTFISPVLIMPLFNKCIPLADGELKDRLLELSRRAGVPVKGVYVSNVSSKETRLNAALTGIGSTRRILLYDTMIEACTPDEVTVVMGHEMGHHVYNHIPKMTVVSSLFLAVVFLVAGFALQPLSAALGLGGLTPAALPLLVVLFAVLGVPLLPVFMATSRQWERDCDQFALKLTQDAPAFISAFRKLASRNLADFEPPRWVYYFLYSHPPIPERIAMAERFARGG